MISSAASGKDAENSGESSRGSDGRGAGDRQDRPELDIVISDLECRE